MSEDIYNIVNEIAEERLRQIELWGQQDHPSVFSANDQREFDKAAVKWKALNKVRDHIDALTWDGILLEEVFEALAEDDDVKRREELIQVAAVAAAEVEAIDRRASERWERFSAELVEDDDQ